MSTAGSSPDWIERLFGRALVLPLASLGVIAIGTPAVMMLKGANLGEPIASYLVFRGQSKRVDALVFGAMLLGLFATAILASLARRRMAGISRGKLPSIRSRWRPSVTSVLTICLALVIGPLVVADPMARRQSMFEVVCWMLLLLGAAAVSVRTLSQDASLSRRALQGVPRLFVAAIFGGLGLAFLLSRAGVRWAPLFGVALMFAFTIAFPSRISGGATEPVNELRGRDWRVWIAEAFSLLLPLHLWPTVSGGIEISQRAKVLVLLLVAGLICLHIRYRPRKSHAAIEPSTAALIAIAIFMQSSPCDGIARLSRDDFHLGEFVLPFQQLRAFGAVPYVDLAPIHGLADLSFGAISQFIGFGSVACRDLAVTWQGGILAALLVVLNSRAIGPWRALFLAVIPVLDSHVWPVLFAFPIVVLASNGGAGWARIALLSALALLSVLWNVSLGIGVAAGAGCLLVSDLLRVISSDRGQRVAMILVMAGSALLLGAWGARDVIFGFVEFVLENGRTSLVAHGIPFQAVGPAWASSELMSSPVGPWLFQALLWLWVIAFAITASLACHQFLHLRRDQWDPIASRLLIFLLIAIPWCGVWASGRIDPGHFSRPGIVTLALLPWVGTFFNPLLKRRGTWALAVSVGVIGCLVALRTGDWTAFSPESKGASLKADRSRSDAAVSGLRAPGSGWQYVDGNEEGMPGLGRIWVSQARWERLKGFSVALHSLVPRGSSWLDLTNGQARYMYFSDRSPSLYPALFNAVSRTHQRRVLEQLQRDPPPVIDVTRNDELAFDGYLVTLRSPMVAEWCLDRYEPVQIGNFCFLVLPGFAPSIPRIPSADRADWFGRLLDNGLAGGHRDLGWLPDVWGSSASVIADFSPQEKPVVDLCEGRGCAWVSLPAQDVPRRLGDMLCLSWETLDDAGPGVAAVSVNLTCVDAVGSKVLEIHANASGRRLIVPLGSFAEWYAGDSIRAVRIAVSSHDHHASTSQGVELVSMRAEIGRFK